MDSRADRITAASYPGALSESFWNDSAGNRTSHTKTDGTTVGYTADATGQLVSDTTGITYSYDAAGNLTGTSDGVTYGYDDYGRTASVTAGATTQTYGYDAAGVRVTVDGVGQLWDRSGLPTRISTSSGDNYVHAAGAARDGDDWLLVDAVGSVRTTVDSAGATIGTADFRHRHGRPELGSRTCSHPSDRTTRSSGVRHVKNFRSQVVCCLAVRFAIGPGQ